MSAPKLTAAGITMLREWPFDKGTGEFTPVFVHDVFNTSALNRLARDGLAELAGDDVYGYPLWRLTEAGCALSRAIAPIAQYTGWRPCGIGVSRDPDEFTNADAEQVTVWGRSLPPSLHESRAEALETVMSCAGALARALRHKATNADAEARRAEMAVRRISGLLNDAAEGATNGGER